MTEEESYTLEEVAEHDTDDDCWIVLNDIVYDISDFVEDPSQHPGGIVLIKEYYGKDISVSFSFKLTTRQVVWPNPDVHEHSERAFDQLQLYKIGTLKK